MAAGDIFSQTFVYIVNGVPCANVFYLKAIDDDPGDDDEESAFNAFEAIILPAIELTMSNQAIWECILSRRVVPTTQPSRVFPLSGTGDIITDSLPANVAWTHRNYTALGSPNHRGRWFFSGLAEAHVSEGRILEQWRGRFQGVTDVVTQPIIHTTHEYRVQMYSKTLGVYNDLEAGSVSPIPTKIRGRTPGICSIS